MFCREGMDVVNARSVAKALNCSTQPIFSYFSGMQDLKTTLEEKAREQFEAALNVKNQSGDPLVETGCAYTRFAAEQPHLFAHLLMTRQDDALYPFDGEERREEMLRREEEVLGLTREQTETLYKHMSIYIHGLAVVCAVQQADYTPEEMAGMIRKTEEMTLKAICA
ncbi:MAG: hypothetical protein ACI4MM_08485 [Candidatus Ventricola sp.]